MDTLGYFWPAIKNESDADNVIRRGAWACLILAAVAILTVTIPGQQAFGIVEAVYLVVAALGIRAKSRIAAVATFAGVFMNSIAGYSSSARYGSVVVDAIILALLFANIRATWLFARWARDLDVEPVSISYRRRFDHTLMNQMPALIWPKARVAFYVLATMLLIVQALSFVVEFKA
jgi:hypothetical protein